MRVLPAGSTGVLVELDDLGQVLALAAHLRDRPLPGVVDLVPAARTVLLVLDPALVTTGETAAAVAALPAGALDGGTGAGATPETVTVPVVYDGEDLAEVGRLTGWGADGVVERHAATTWTVAFSGFAPGFGYCVADDGPAWQVPRRSSPRTRVPAGSVAVADGWTGVYPTASPGGWQLLGRTPAAVWDLDREPPALLRPGVRVRFVPVPGGPGVSLEVLAAGPLSTVQDEGRTGYASWGVPRSGACDRGAYRLGLRLVGDDPGTASLEVTLGGLAVVARRPLVVAVTGARCPGAPWSAPVRLAAGEVLRLGTPAEGLRSYLAVRGGIDVPPVLGSRSTCTLSGLGPARLAVGDVLPVGPATAPMPGVDEAAVPAPAAGTVVVDLEPGPRLDRVGGEGWRRLVATTLAVGTDSDRVGARLVGARLEPAPGWAGAELASEGVLRGAVQVPPSGEPVVFLADAPVTGGYPVVAYVRDPPRGSDVDRLAQARPGQQVRFRASRSRIGA